MKLIVGLGNPGKKYARTRHNIGFMTVDHFLKDAKEVENFLWTVDERFKGEIALSNWDSGKNVEKIVLLKPRTYMNNSGLSVVLTSLYYKIDPADIWVVYDDLDLPLGSMKIRFGGASAGHHGIDSIMQHIKTDKFWRFRLGIGVRHLSGRRPEEGDAKSMSHQTIKNADDFVLGTFNGGQWGKARELIQRGSKAVTQALEKGLESAMNRYNTK